jgi:hypothetical protein
MHIRGETEEILSNIGCDNHIVGRSEANPYPLLSGNNSQTHQ